MTDERTMTDQRMTDAERDLIYGWDAPDRDDALRSLPPSGPLADERLRAEQLRADLRALGRPSSTAPPPLDWGRLQPPRRRRWLPMAAAAAVVVAGVGWWVMADRDAAPTPAVAVAPTPPAEAMTLPEDAPAEPLREAPGAVDRLIQVRFRVEAADAARVAVAGDFNDWKPETLPMSPVGGQWQAEAALPPGRYAYMYVVDGRWITPPDAQRTQDDGFGARNGVLNVLEPPGS